MDDERVIRVLLIVFGGVMWGVFALVKEREDQRRLRALMSELTALRLAMQREGYQTRQFLEFQEVRRLRALAREAQIQLDAQSEADAAGRGEGLRGVGVGEGREE